MNAAGQPIGETDPPLSVPSLHKAAEDCGEMALRQAIPPFLEPLPETPNWLGSSTTEPATSEDDPVNAINLVEVDFYNCRKVEAAWNSYKSHLNDSSKPEDEAWHETKERLLAKLLFEIAAVLGFKIPALDIFKGGYAPKGWAHRDLRAVGALEYVYELSQGTKSVPVWLAGLTPPQSTAVSLPNENKPMTS
jgi:hypothetical protein